jgi:hypothetical protein
MSYVVAESSRAVSLWLAGDRPDTTDGCVVGRRRLRLGRLQFLGDLERRVYAQAMAAQSSCCEWVKIIPLSKVNSAGSSTMLQVPPREAVQP